MRVIKRKGSKRNQEKIFYNELIPVEGVGNIRIKISNKIADRLQTHAEALLTYRGIPSLNSTNYQNELSEKDNIVSFYYQKRTDIEQLPHQEALFLARQAAFDYYQQAEQAARIAGIFIALLDDNFVTIWEGARPIVRLRPELEQLVLDDDYFEDDENEIRTLSLLPPKTKRSRFVPQEQMLAIIEALQDIDEGFAKQLSVKMQDVIKMIQEGKLTASEKEADEGGFRSGNVGANTPETIDAPSLEERPNYRVITEAVRED